MIPFKQLPNGNRIQFFASPEEYHEYARTSAKHSKSGDNDFYGSEYPVALKMLQNGDTKNVEAVEKLLSKFQELGVFVNRQRTVETHVSGHMPHISNAIRNLPKSMYRKQIIDNPSMSSPIRIFCEVAVSAGVTQSQLLSRGTSTMALAMALNAVRPVELYAVSGSSYSREYGANSSCIQAVKVCDSQIDIARAAMILTTPEFCRRLNFATGAQLVGLTGTYSSIGWYNRVVPSSSSYSPMMRDALECETDDIFLPGGYLANTLVLTDPVKWVQDMIASHTNKFGDDEEN